MLHELHIKDFAIIQDLHLEFEKGLNVITGETGAGKSIIIDALQTLLGGKAQQEQIREGAREALIEGQFTLPPHFSLKEKYLDSNYLSENEREIIVRRVISSSGKNKSYINGNMVNLSVLTELSEELLEIHGQNDQASLFKKTTQMGLLDSFGNIIPLKKEYDSLYLKWNRLHQAKSEMEKEERGKKEKKLLLLYQLDELERAGPSLEEESVLRKEREIIYKSEFLKGKSSESYHLLIENEDSAVLSRLQVIDRLLSDLRNIDPQVEPIIHLLNSARIHLKEAGGLLRDYREKVESKPGRLEKIDQRLYEISQLKKKYGKSIEEVIQYFDHIKKETAALDGLEEEVKKVTIKIVEIEKELDNLGGQLSNKRKEAARKLEKSFLKELTGLKIKEAQFQVRFHPLPGEERFSRNGKESVSFLISMNPGYPPSEIEKVASGGELSRVMLALKTVLSAEEAVPVLIFDEIDSGVGGAVAEFIGKRLREISAFQQVFCVTHLAQIAVYGQVHFYVDKKIKKGMTDVTVMRLESKERIQEISRMLGGIKITPNTVKHAEEMIAKTAVFNQA